MEYLRFAIIGLGAGAVYALSALGIVMVYRGSGVVNFAHGAIGMVGAFIFYNLTSDEVGLPLAAAMAIALAFGGLVGAFIHWVVLRRMSAAPALIRLICTLAVLGGLVAFSQHVFGGDARIVAKLLPVKGVEVLPGISIGLDRLILLGVGVGLTVVLAVVFRYTSFGLATTAVAENRRAAAAQGISPDLVATVNWVLGSVLAVLSAILIVNLTGLQVTGLTLLVIPALAAALIGGFRSFTLTLLGGMLIGVLEAEVAYLGIRFPSLDIGSWSRSVPFLVIIAVLVISGRGLPLRDEPLERPWQVGTGRLNWRLLIPGIVVTVSLLWWVLSVSVIDATMITCAAALVMLSLVVLTGYTGQVSLAQFALAGMGAWIATRLVASFGAPYELASLAGILGAIPIGVVVGLPALRTRGVNLAVATLGLAVVIQTQVMENADLTGGMLGLYVGNPTFLGFNLDRVRYPERYAVLAFGIFIVCCWLVGNLRRGRAGRRLIAVRSNERAAAAMGISVFRAKMFAFGLAAALAATGGVLLGFRRPNVVFLQVFDAFQSIFAVLFAVIGGIGYVIGATFLGAPLADGALAPVVFDKWFHGIKDWIPIVAPIALVLGLAADPDGGAHFWANKLGPLARRLHLLKPVEPSTLPEVQSHPVAPATLEVEGVTVRFGGVVALQDVSLRVEPGRVVGLIGPNGAGKTTFIDAVTGFVRCRTGKVLLGGRDVSTWSARRRSAAGLSRSFQSLELFEGMTVFENLRTASDRRDLLSYVTNLFHPGNEPLAAAATAAVHEFGLEADLDRPPEALSYGRRRLVAIARAVAMNPSVLLLDEPAAGLDPLETAELGRLIQRLASDWGIGVLLVEHDVSLVLDVCDRVAVLQFGQKVAEGTPAEVRRDPAVIAAYLGEKSAETAVTVRERRSAEQVPAVEAKGLSAGYGDLAAVHEIDLAVYPGEVVALLGPNGAGKTTTLLTLAGELPPLGGRVHWLGSDRLAPLHRRVRDGLAFVPEERSVIKRLTTSDNLRLGKRDVEAALRLFPELADRAGLRAGLLSGGEQQMLALGRALASNPRVLLADELSLGLAPKLVTRLLSAVRAAADRGVAVLMVEQHASQALEIADRVYVLRRGRIEIEGTAAEVRGRLVEVEQAYLTGVAPPA